MNITLHLQMRTSDTIEDFQESVSWVVLIHVVKFGAKNNPGLEFRSRFVTEVLHCLVY